MQVEVDHQNGDDSSQDSGDEGVIEDDGSDYDQGDHNGDGGDLTDDYEEDLTDESSLSLDQPLPKPSKSPRSSRNTKPGSAANSRSPRPAPRQPNGRSSSSSSPPSRPMQGKLSQSRRSQSANSPPDVTNSLKLSSGSALNRDNRSSKHIKPEIKANYTSFTRTPNFPTQPRSKLRYGRLFIATPLHQLTPRGFQPDASQTLTRIMLMVCLPLIQLVNF